MKTSTILIVLAVLLTKCASVNKMTNNAIYHSIVGQNEMTVYKRLGVPANTVSTSDGGKKLIYEYYGKGMYATPYKSRVIYNPKKDALGNSEGLIIHGGANTVTNDPKYTIYEKDVPFLEVFLDKEGKCVRFQQNLPKKQLEILYEQFKKYIPED